MAGPCKSEAALYLYNYFINNLYHTVQGPMLSKGTKRAIFCHITVILRYCWDKTIARNEDMYRDDSGILIIGYRLNMAKYARPRSLSGTADRACEVCFRSKTEGGHISPYSVYNLFITYFTPPPEFIFCKLSYCNLRYLKSSTLSELRLIRLEKIAESFC